MLISENTVKAISNLVSKYIKGHDSAILFTDQALPKSLSRRVFTGQEQEALEIISCTLSTLFSQLEANNDGPTIAGQIRPLRWSVQVSFVEVQESLLIDLLNTANFLSRPNCTWASGSITQKDIYCIEDAWSYLILGLEHRSSSASSHALFSIVLTQEEWTCSDTQTMTASYPANSGEWHKRVSSFHSVDLVTLDSSILPVSISRTLKNALDGRDTALIVNHEKPIKSTPHQPTASLETVGHRNTMFCVPEIERIKILEQALEEANQKVNQMNHHLWDHEQGTQITLGLRLEELEKTKLQLKTLEQIEEKQTAIIEQLLTKQESMEVLLKRQQIHSVKMMEEFARAKADTTRYFQHKIEHVVKEVTRISAVRKDLEKRMSDIQDQKTIEKRSSDIDLQRTMALEGRVEELDMIIEKLDFQKKRTSAALTRKTSAYRQMEQCLERHAAVIKTYEKKIKVLEKALEAGNLAPNRTNLLDESETTTVPVDPGEKDVIFHEACATKHQDGPHSSATNLKKVSARIERDNHWQGQRPLRHSHQPTRSILKKSNQGVINQLDEQALQAQCQEWLAKGKEETLIYKMVEICKDNKYLIVQMQDMQNELNLWHQHAAMLRDTHRHSNPKKPISPKTHKVGCEGRPDHTLHRTLLRSTDNLENMHSFKHNSSPNLHLPPPTAPPSNPPPPIPSSPSSRSSTKPIEKDNRLSQQNIRDLKRRLSHAEAAAFSMAKKLDAVLQEKEGLDLETTRWKTQVDKLLEAQAAKEAKAAKVQQELEKQLEEERTLKAKSEKARQLLESQTDVWLSKKSVFKCF